MLGVVTVDETNTPLTWPNGDGTGQPSSTFTLPLAVPTADGTLLLTPAQARGGLSVTANPASTNSYEGVIFIDDSAIAGPAVYAFKISWCDGAGDNGGVTRTGGVTGAAGGGGATGSGGSVVASDAGAGGPRFVLENYGVDMCDPTSRSANGTLTATGKIWLLKNVGSSGTVDVTVSVTGASNVGSSGKTIPGEPDISRQFSVLAGASYVLIVGLPVFQCGTFGAGCPGGSLPCVGPSYGPLVTVAFSGMPSEVPNYPFSSTVAAFGPYTLTCPNGESVIGLEEGSSTRVPNYTGNFVAPCLSLPGPAGCITTNASGATCSVAGDLYCGGTVCCSPSYPHFCSATQKCYSTSAAAAQACGSVSCSECAATGA
jgi:hypothetical protein